ncbi:ABC transporter ATP-binding protein [Dermacoccaceae bacterium W4C1]
MSVSTWEAMQSATGGDAVAGRRLHRETVRRVLTYAAPHRRRISVLLGLTVLSALLVVSTPLLLLRIIDDGVVGRDSSLVVRLALLVAVVALVDAALNVVMRWISAAIGEGLILDLRRQVFGHVLRQPVDFFTQTRTGALVTRLNSDVVGAQQAFTSVLSNVVSNVLALGVVLVTMVLLSWQLTLLTLLVVPLILLPTRRMGGRLAQLSRVQMSRNAELGDRMSERFNVAGALLVKLYGRPVAEDEQFADRAGQVRDAGVAIAVNRGIFMTALTTMATLATAIVYGVGGVLAIEGGLTIGALTAMAALLGRLYGPLTTLSNVRIDVMTAMVAFERIFEILDLPSRVAEPQVATPLPDGPLDIDFDGVSFAHPDPATITLDSLGGDGEHATGDEAQPLVLTDIDLHVPAGRTIALVGPSGAGKTTLTTLIARLADPSSGAVRLGGVDLRQVSADERRARIGVVSQDAHLFHDTVRANLLYARPEATQEQLHDALRRARIDTLVRALPQGLDTVVGDRGHRLSGGEKQRLALARLMLTEPSIIVLDEATAHLDSESEAAVQQALNEVLHGRTAVVVAHRLATVRDADEIVVLDGGAVIERGTHGQLLARGGLYADLYATQFGEQAAMSVAEQECCRQSA